MTSTRTEPDARGVPLTAASARSARAYDAALSALVAHRAELPARLEELFGLDPELAVAHVIVGFGARLLGRRSLLPAARASLGRARASAAARPVTPRETHLIEALAASVDGHTDRAIARLEAAVALEPLDLLAIKLSHALSFMLGRSASMRQNLERIEPAWRKETLVGGGAVRGCLAFALVETGELERAESVGRQACELEPNLWSIHALVHVHHTRGEVRQGASFIARHQPLMAEGSNLGLHLAWHHALFEIAQRRPEAALATYDARLAAVLTPDFRDFVNAVSLLHRIELAGCSVGARWEALADIAQRDGPGHGLGFAEVHYVLALSCAGRSHQARALLLGLSAEASEPLGSDESIRREVALPLARALLEAPAARAEILEALQPSLIRLGGSRVQRELFTLVGSRVLPSEPMGAARAGALLNSGV